MAVRTTHKGKRSRCSDVLHRPRGLFHSRVQQVGPEHFGIVSVDCAKARSKWMLADFYGKVLIPPTVVAHNRVELDATIAQIRQALTTNGLYDMLVAIERTGRYHHVIRDAFVRAEFEARLVHPFATKRFRQPADPSTKTDDTDLAAIHRAAVNGFALLEPKLSEDWQSLQVLVRHRRNLVQKNAALRCQIREHLEAAWPGYAACFDELWDSHIAQALIRRYATPLDLLTESAPAIDHWLRQQGVRFQRPTLDTILVWAQRATPGDPLTELHRRLALAYDDDRLQKTQEIQALERDLARRLAQTPYVLLLSFPGINVVSAAEFAGEMGPIEHYANPRNITGRAGLFPSRYQSDQVDRPHGPLVRRGNRKLRAAILGVADNLLACNQHFKVLATRWKALGKHTRHTHVKIALRFCRIAFHMVAGRQVFHHPGLRERHYILDKLLAFHTEHQTPWEQTLRDLHYAIDQVPTKERGREAQPLADRLQRWRQRRRGPQALAEILAIVLARLGVGIVQSQESGEQDPT